MAAIQRSSQPSGKCGQVKSCTRRSHAGLVEELSGDGTKGATVEVGTRGLDHPLRVALTDRPRVLLRAPGAVPVEVTDGLVAVIDIDKVERAFGSRGGVRPSAGVDLELFVGANDLAFNLVFANFLVFVAWGEVSFALWTKNEDN